MKLPTLKKKRVFGMGSVKSSEKREEKLGWKEMWNLLLKNSCERKNLELAKLCLDKGAEVREESLYLACYFHRSDFVDLFLEKGVCDLNSCFKMACKAENRDTALKLLERGVSKVDGKKAERYLEEKLGENSKAAKRGVEVKTGLGLLSKVPVEESDTVLDFQRKIEKRLGVAFELQKIHVDEHKNVDPTRKASDYNIRPGFTVFVGLRLKERLFMSVEVGKGKWVPYGEVKRWEREDTLQSLKRKIEEEEGIPAGQQILQFLVGGECVCLGESEQNVSLGELFRVHNFVLQQQQCHLLLQLKGLEWSADRHFDFDNNIRKTIFLFLLCLSRLNSVKLPKPILSTIVNLSLL